MYQGEGTPHGLGCSGEQKCRLSGHGHFWKNSPVICAPFCICYIHIFVHIFVPPFCGIKRQFLTLAFRAYYDWTYLLSLTTLVRPHQEMHHSVHPSYAFLLLHPLPEAVMSCPLRSSQILPSLCLLPWSLFRPLFWIPFSLEFTFCVLLIRDTLSTNTLGMELSKIPSQGLQSWKLSSVSPSLMDNTDFIGPWARMANGWTHVWFCLRKAL